MPLAAIDAGRVLGEFLAKDVGMNFDAASLTMLGRSVGSGRACFSGLTPDRTAENQRRTSQSAFDAQNLRERLEKLLLQITGSSEKLTAIPAQVSDALARVLSGRVTLNVNIAGQEQESREKNRRNARLSLSIVASSMILGAGLFSLSGAPGPGGLPWPSSLLLIGAAALFAALAFPPGRR
jgi:hypothetical protein